MEKARGSFVVVLITVFIVSSVQAEILHLWVDDTLSVLPEARAAGINNLCKQIPVIIKKYGITEIRVHHLGHDPWVVQPDCFQVLRLNGDPCKDTKMPGELGIFKTLKAHAETACEEQRKRERSEYEAQLAAILPSIQEALTKSPERGSPCTAVYDTLIRVSNEQGLVVLITDGVETCHRSIFAIPMSPNTKRILILLIPSKDDSGKGKSAARTFNARKTLLGEIIPWARIEPLFSDRISESLDERKTP